jgi:enoyl-CoA hydratase/carnithine racemase
VLNRRIDSTELLARGLVDQLVDGGAALTTATAVASHLADISADALLATRTLVDSATSNALDRHLEAESVAFTALWDTPAFRDAVAVYAGDTGEAGDATP